MPDRKLQVRKMMSIIRLEFDELENAGLEIDRLTGRFLEALAASKSIAVEQSLK